MMITKCTPQAVLGAVGVLLGCATVARAELTTPEEASRVARNHVRLMVAQGRWSTSPDPVVGPVQEFKRGDRVLGYFCPVLPVGHVVLSLHKELEPVKAFSATCDLDPNLEEGLTDLLKDRMEGILDAVSRKIGRAVGPADRFEQVLEINYRPAFDILDAADFDPQRHLRPAGRSRTAGMNYQEGEVLLTSNWHQHAPYNHFCFNFGCTPECDGFSTNVLVGCTATAGAQIMRHWRWAGPPDRYDWPNMLDGYYCDGNGWFLDSPISPPGRPVTWAEIDAVAELSNEVALQVGTTFGCEGSGAFLSDMEGVYEFNSYTEDCCVIHREDYTALTWFGALQQQIDQNRPVQYSIPGHSIVADGWKLEWVDPDYYWYHMNYGWGSFESDNTWYALDALPGSFWMLEHAASNIVPVTAIGGVILPGAYPGGVWRYLDQDTYGTTATFLPDQTLQILKPGFWLRALGTAEQTISFLGSPGNAIRFFLQGDVAGKTRILIHNGGMSIHSGGEMVIR